MSRPIEFRVWDNDSCIMIYDVGIDINGVAYRLDPHRSLDGSDDFIYYSDGEIMQYTGIIDRIGTKIFEGDYVEHNSFQPFFGEERETHEVLFTRGAFKIDDCGLGDPNSELLVIGNIFEDTL